MKKIAMKAIPLACAVTAPFFMNADEQELYAASMPNLTNSKLATSTGMQSAKAATQTQTTNQVTPPAGPLVSNGADVYVTADFLWWKAEQSGLQYGFNGAVATATSGTTNASRGHVHYPNFKYEPGFKVGLGILCEHDNWDLFAQYTWLHSTATGSASDHGSLNRLFDASSIIEGGTGYVDQFAYSSMHTDWEFHFNVLDLELGRNFWISDRLTLRPFAGMKFSWLKQDVDVHGHTILTTASSLGHEMERDLDLKEWGVGLRGGINAAFYMWNKWSIYGDLAFTGLWNDMDSSRHEKYAASTTATEYTYYNIHSNSHPITAVMEVGLGLRFETIFSKGKYMYMLQAGWEDQVWFNQGEFINVTNPSAHDNLSLGGLTVKTGFYF